MKTLTFDHRIIGKYLLWTICFFACANMVLIALATLGLDGNIVHWMLWRLLYLDREQNIPTFFSSLILLAAAVLAAVNGRLEPHGKMISTMWVLLSLCLLAVSLDEFISMHEIYGSKIGLAMMGDSSSADNFEWNAKVQVGGLEVLQVFAWVLPAACGLLLASPFAYRFLRSLPPRTRLRVLASGVTYICGALGFEVFNALIESRLGYDSRWYEIGTVVEECLEMIGVTMFIVAMLQHMSTRISSIRVDLL